MSCSIKHTSPRDLSIMTLIAIPHISGFWLWAWQPTLTCYLLTLTRQLFHNFFYTACLFEKKNNHPSSKPSKSIFFLQLRVNFVAGCKVRTFWEAKKNWCFRHLLRKRTKHEEDFFKFCVFLRKSELYYVLGYVHNYTVKSYKFWNYFPIKDLQ